MLNDENYEFFIQMYKVSTFRKCVENETIYHKYQKLNHIYFLWSGRILVKAPKIGNLFDLQINKIYQGEDFGYNCFFNKGRSYLTLKCITDCDLV